MIESGGHVDGPAATIKLHHNVGGLPDDLQFELIEPLRDLFKDEVRRLGEQLGLPTDIVWRHPFPGPGLAVRCLGEVTRERLVTLREADAIVGRGDQGGRASTARRRKRSPSCCRCKSVGVMGDARTYADVVAVRSIDSEDFMTADWSQPASRPPGPHLHPHHQRNRRREPRRLRHQLETPRNDRVGVEGEARGERLEARDSR